MRLAALLSGGKDSLYALYQEQQKGHDIKLIITFLSENQESYMFHTPNIHLVAEQAKLMNIPIVQIKTKGEKEKELEDIRAVLRKQKTEIDGVVTGATASNYQKSRIDAICHELELASLAPLWNAPPEQTLRRMVADGFRIMIVAVAAPPLDETWLGRIVNAACIDDLVALNKKYGIHILFEGGEAESLVLDCPLFSKQMIVVSAEKQWDIKTRSGRLAITDVSFKEKSQ
ncbi:MAG: TIGR00289 family protein [Candidatus Aenigmarchaeota archaeon]|nr:TIGR00289 family protein [Candidatus Aenigmarchaeota archaeon]